MPSDKSYERIVINSINIEIDEKFAKCNPQLHFLYRGVKKKTSIKKNTLKPEWNENIEFELEPSEDYILVQLKDYQKIGTDRLLGKGVIQLDLDSEGIAQELEIDLADTKNYKLESPLHFSLMHIKSSSNDDSSSTNHESTNTVLNEIKPQKYRSDKRQDFQIRIKVFQARQLDGNNISPRCSIKCSNVTKYTKTMKSTNSPFWDEVFFFNFISSEKELFKDVIEFNVLDYSGSAFTRNELVGSFATDIGFIYDEPSHSIIHKWLLLGDPEDNTTGAKGYLNVTVNVLGPGDQVPPQNPELIKSEDIESNLLKPPGVFLKSAHYNIKVFQAEDLPRMDSSLFQGIKTFFTNEEKKELVDPFVNFSFAGKNIKSRIFYNDAKPAWNQLLKLDFKFPSMCEKIKINIMDWDRTGDDYIATIELPVSLISNLQADGFLPTFGPCFLSMYGSPREYSEIPTCLGDLNNGNGEGVAYRGRIMIEIGTSMTEIPKENIISDLKNVEILKNGQLLNRVKYKLHGAFFNATMLAESQYPVEFEISIGNYGNKLDDSCVPCASTTPLCDPVFDGCSHYYLPWGNRKPCIQILSYWEDITFRFEAINQIRNLKNFVLDFIKGIKIKMAYIGETVYINTTEMSEMAISVLKSIEIIKEKASKPLPELNSSKNLVNELDRLRRGIRVKTMKEIVSKCKRLPNLEFKYVLEELESILSSLEKIEAEPQNSIPDVIIWMIIGNERKAYYRIPAYQVYYSKNPDYRGEFCNLLQTITLKWPGRMKDEFENRFKIPGQVRLKLWFGHEKEETDWLQPHLNEEKHGALLIYAETFENQLFSWTAQKWDHDGLGRPKFSDANGKISLGKEDFKLPEDWEWKGDWEVIPENSLIYNKDAFHSVYMEEIFEQNFRYLPGGSWHEGHKDKKPFMWTDGKIDKYKAKEDITLPDNWEWTDEWEIDINRAVDPEGWEYCLELSMAGWSPSEKVYQLYRRRRWVRNRSVVKRKVYQTDEVKKNETEKEGWMYAILFSSKFHPKEAASDRVRRRRWLRSMQPKSVNSDLSAVFRFEHKNEKSDEKKKKEAVTFNVPKLVLKYKESNKYQLRAHIYQARSLLAADTDTSSSDPYCQIAFLNQSMRTEIKYKSLCPTWDQTLIFDMVEIYGFSEEIERSPPTIMIEVFDKDNSGESDFLGRCTVRPTFMTAISEPTKLQWFELKRNNEDAGELLACFEIYKVDVTNLINLPPMPPKLGLIYKIPTEIRPKLQRTIIEVLSWGVRNLKKFQLSDIESPQITFTCGDKVLETEIIKNVKSNPNCAKPVMYFDLMIPTEEIFIPPITIKIIDHRNFGRKPVVGTHMIDNLNRFRVNRDKDKRFHSNIDNEIFTVVNIDSEDDDKVSKKLKGFIKMKKIFNRNLTRRKSKYELVSKQFGNVVKEELVEEDIDWWCKFYASIGNCQMSGSYLSKGYDKLVVYDDELENQDKFENFLDFCQSFKVKRGKTVIEEEENNYVGEMKGTFKMYSVLENSCNIAENLILKNILPMGREECVLRVYVIRGIELQAKDSNGKSDAYIQIKCGKKVVDNRSKYVPNSNSPEFGKMFELKIMLPLEKDLCVRIKDYDLIGTDEVVGETWIDLENRFISKYRGTCGLPENYNETGVNAWRDSKKPSEILAELCKLKGFSCSLPNEDETICNVDNNFFSLDKYEPKGKNLLEKNKHLGAANERLCLHVLKEFELVPEHIETRKLYNPIQPGMEQGRLQMWVDIFPKSKGPPGPEFDISPRTAKKYVLRCIVWNTAEVPCDDVSLTGELMSDIYVKGWIQGLENDKQSTDIHYRSMDGDGNFNWRFVYDFEYLPSEENIFIKKKDHIWSLDETIVKLPPVLTFQVWDNDKFSADDFIGQLTLNLNKMIKPAKTAKSCGLHQLPPEFEEKSKKKTSEKQTISLFGQKRVKGWWPCIMDLPDGKREIAGKLELEFEILTEEDALIKPAGRGRDEPNENPKLDPPARPETSFVWFMSPWKTFKHIIWNRYRYHFILAIFLAFLVIFGILMVYTMPGALWNVILK